MKTSIAFLLLAVTVAAHAQTSGTPGPVSESRIGDFVLACFNALGSGKWLDNARCYDRTQLAEFQRLYLQRSEESAPGTVPQEFVAHYKAGISLDRLKAADPAEFFAAFNGGWAALLTPQGPCKYGPAGFAVARVEANGQDRYLVTGTTTARRICGERTQETSRTDTIAIRVRDGKPSVEMPQRTFELLGAGR